MNWQRQPHEQSIIVRIKLQRHARCPVLLTNPLKRASAEVVGFLSEFCKQILKHHLKSIQSFGLLKDFILQGPEGISFTCKWEENTSDVDEAPCGVRPQQHQAPLLLLALYTHWHTGRYTQPTMHLGAFVENWTVFSPHVSTIRPHPQSGFMEWRKI